MSSIGTILSMFTFETENVIFQNSPEDVSCKANVVWRVDYFFC